MLATVAKEKGKKEECENCWPASSLEKGVEKREGSLASRKAC